MKKVVIIIIFCVSLLVFIFLMSKSNSLVFDSSIKKGYFEYIDPLDYQIYQDNYYYSDSYFNDDNKMLDHLRTFALSLTLSINSTHNSGDIYYYIDKFLNELDFYNTVKYDLEQFNKDTIGTVISTKKLSDDYNLVVVSLRGVYYEEEWESNLDVSTSGNVKGFDDSSKIVLSRIKEYIEKNEFQKYKLLITGYSRSAAIANLIGVYLNNNLDEYKLKSKDLYVYCFGSPNGSSSDKIYKNIHNIVNKNDFVTYVYPESWELYNNGIVEDITTNNELIQEKYLNIMNKKIDLLNKVDKQEFIKNIVDILFNKEETLITRNEFNNVSKSIYYLYSLYTNKSISELNKLFDYLKDTVNLLEYNDIINLIIYNKYDSIIDILDNNYNEISDVLSIEEYNNLKKSIINVYDYFNPVIKYDYQYNRDGNTYSFLNIITFIDNLYDIFKEHSFYTTFEQVKKIDTYYK